MADISRDTFNKSRHYSGVRMQQGRVLLDSDWNEQEDIRKWEVQSFLRWFIGEGVPEKNNGFRIFTHKAGWKNDFIIEGGDGSTEGAGRCLVQGWEVLNESDLKYTKQKLFKNNELGGKWGLDPLPELTVPKAERSDLVYLDVWEREVNGLEDPDIQNPVLGVDTCVRIKREWAVRVYENSGTLPPPIKNHAYYPLARLNRKRNEALIRQENITDLRTTVPSLVSALSGATGKVVFLAKGGKEQLSGEIDPGLGRGKFAVHMALEANTDGKFFIGPPEAMQVFRVVSNVHIGALVDPASGRFQIGIRDEKGINKDVKVRWWAFRPRREARDVTVK